MLDAQDRQRRILIVDDDVAIQRLIKTVLQKDDCSCEVVADGEQAIHAIALQEPDVMLLDLMLPVLNGFQVLEILRTRFPHLLRETIVISAASTKVLQDIERYEAELAAVIRKPFDIGDLRDVVRRCDPASQESPGARGQAASKNSHAT